MQPGAMSPGKIGSSASVFGSVREVWRRVTKQSRKGKMRSQPQQQKPLVVRFVCPPEYPRRFARWSTTSSNCSTSSSASPTTTLTSLKMATTSTFNLNFSGLVDQSTGRAAFIPELSITVPGPVSLVEDIAPWDEPVCLFFPLFLSSHLCSLLPWTLGWNPSVVVSGNS